MRQFVLKLHSRCNLACSYCYIYEGADQSWREKPGTMSRAVIDLAAARIGEHVAAYRPPWIEVVLHGGEPLMAGLPVLRHAAEAVRAAVGDRAGVRVIVQTNGILLTERMLAGLDEAGMLVAVSLDGGQADNDRHRRFRDGRGSHEAVAAALRTVTSERFRHMFVGVLGVIDLESEPRAVYETLAAWDPPTLDLLLPHRTWEDPPPAGARYAAWLSEVFDTWYGSGSGVRVRIFDEIIAVLLGARTGTTAIGAGPVQHVTVETDGTIEADDILKIAYAGAPATGLNLRGHSFDDYLAAPAMRERQNGIEALCRECRDCPVVEVCGGGTYPHRYRPGHGFANPSAYCEDLKVLIRHVRDTVIADLPQLEPTSRG
ncbi:MAG: FxsB family radical SAM/SPASM domain protein [Catenulispora sp.]|nr:FxsB family radical SAM/SPASM domain protein [Catenulispora sp.]